VVLPEDLWAAEMRRRFMGTSLTSRES